MRNDLLRALATMDVEAVPECGLAAAETEAGERHDRRQEERGGRGLAIITPRCEEAAAAGRDRRLALWPLRLEETRRAEQRMVRHAAGALLLQLRLQFGEEQGELALWILLGPGACRALASLASTCREFRSFCYMWCDMCEQRVLCPGRRIVAFPRDRPFVELVPANQCCTYHRQVVTAFESSSMQTIYGHDRRCVCPGCRAGREYGYIYW